MEAKMDKDFDHIPLSHSSVSLKLADIQKRCSALLNEPGELTELSLEEPSVQPLDNDNPYDRG